MRLQNKWGHIHPEGQRLQLTRKTGNAFLFFFFFFWQANLQKSLTAHRSVVRGEKRKINSDLPPQRRLLINKQTKTGRLRRPPSLTARKANCGGGSMATPLVESAGGVDRISPFVRSKNLQIDLPETIRPSRASKRRKSTRGSLFSGLTSCVCERLVKG